MDDLAGALNKLGDTQPGQSAAGVATTTNPTEAVAGLASAMGQQGGIDAVLLVIAADESVMPQTREHFAICRLLQVRSGVIALTKSDLVDADTLEIARLDARELVAGSALADAPIVAVSSKTGAGLETLRTSLAGIAAAAPSRAAEAAPSLLHGHPWSPAGSIEAAISRRMDPPRRSSGPPTSSSTSRSPSTPSPARHS